MSKTSKIDSTRSGSTTDVPVAPSLTAMQRADALLQKMTIEEKAMQLSAVYPMALLGPDGPIKSQLDAQLKHGIGHGASKTITFVVPMSVLAYTGLTGELVIEPGPVEMSVGSSSSDIRSSASFTVTGKTRTIKAGDRAFLSVATLGS